jgi:hypothetical protein
MPESKTGLNKKEPQWYHGTRKLEPTIPSRNSNLPAIGQIVFDASSWGKAHCENQEASYVPFYLA